MVCWTRTYGASGCCGKGRCAVLTRNGTALVKGDESEFSHERPGDLSIASFDSATAILCYSDCWTPLTSVNCPYKCCAVGVSGTSISQNCRYNADETPLSSEQHGLDGSVAVLDAHTALVCYRSKPCARIPHSCRMPLPTLPRMPRKRGLRP